MLEANYQLKIFGATLLEMLKTNKKPEPKEASSFRSGFLSAIHHFLSNKMTNKFIFIQGRSWGIKTHIFCSRT